MPSDHAAVGWATYTLLPGTRHLYDLVTPCSSTLFLLSSIVCAMLLGTWMALPSL